jgi:hypothetical protein
MTAPDNDGTISRLDRKRHSQDKTRTSLNKRHPEDKTRQDKTRQDKKGNEEKKENTHRGRVKESTYWFLHINKGWNNNGEKKRFACGQTQHWRKDNS